VVVGAHSTATALAYLSALNSLLPKAALVPPAPRTPAFPSRHCDVSRHSSGRHIQGLAALSHYCPSLNNSHPSTIMSLSYESRSFPMTESNYPQMEVMLEDHQDQPGIQEQHNQYPSPPRAHISENPYQAPHLAPSPDDGMEVPNLPSHESEAPTSPGRSKPIPKPDREVTKGPDGRYVCMYDNCTEEVRDFGRKVRFPPANHFFLLADRTVSVSGRNTWTNTIGHISVQRMAVRNYQASLTRVVSFDTSVRCTISMVDRENSSTALTTPASAILEKGSPVKRI
jgi:hypothetical protein